MDRGVIATAAELLEGRHYPGVVALCSDALDNEPECVPLLVLRARARVALRRDLDAQADLRDIIRLDPGCGLAYRLLGELAARQDEHASAAVFFREALRLDPGDREAHDWLMIVSAPLRPAAAVDPLPAPTGAGPLSTPPRGQPRMARGTQAPSTKAAEPIEPSEPSAGVVDPYDAYDERPTQPFPRPAGLAAAVGGRARTATVPTVERPIPLVRIDPEPLTARGDSQLRSRRVESQPSVARAESQLPTVRMDSQPSIVRAGPELPTARAEAPLATGPAPRAAAAGPAGDLPGFGEYLVATGILTRERLRAAQAYQRSMRVQLSTAVVTLGLASAERVAWAAVAHQSRLSRERRP